MAYTLTQAQWYAKMGYNNYGEPLRIDKLPRRTPMRPINERIVLETDHFVVMFAVVNKWGGRKVALIEKACSSTKVTRIDKRLKSIKRIIKEHRVRNINHHSGKISRMYYRLTGELIDLQQKCERMYPCHFLVKGVDYARADRGDSQVLDTGA